MGIVGVTNDEIEAQRALVLNSRLCNRKVAGPESPKVLLNPQFRAPSAPLMPLNSIREKLKAGLDQKDGCPYKTQCAG